MTRFTCLLFFFLFHNSVKSTAQTPAAAAENLIANPGFESFSAVPIGWFKKGEHYTRVMKYWESPTAASPDIFGPKVRVPTYWAEKGFGVQPPHSGGAMSGLTTYGCAEKKTHCREYIAARLNEPLVVGQIYYAEFYVSHLPGSYFSNNLGMLFSEKQIYHKTDELITGTPQISASDILEIKKGKWQKIAGQFTAAAASEYLLIGNFFSDADSEFKADQNNTIPYAYYYIDDVTVKKLPPYLPVPVRPDDLTLQTLETGKTFVLKDIYFDFDKWDLHPRSFVELKKLRQIMEENPELKIEIIGHTDSIGEREYNQYLSRKRAKSVTLYLLENGISGTRLEYKGEGESMPTADNRYEAGRKMNRRVEFRITAGG